MENEEKYYRIADVSIKEAIERCVKVHGIEGTEDTIKRVYSHPDLRILKELFLEALYKKYKIGRADFK